MTFRARLAALLRADGAERAPSATDLAAAQDALTKQLAELREAIERRVAHSTEDILDQLAVGRAPTGVEPAGGTRNSRILNELTVLREENAALHEQFAQLASGIADARADIDGLRDDVWASKVVRVGDRLLVGSRHLNLVFLLEADDRLIVPRFVVEGQYEPPTTSFLMQTVQPDSICIDVGANFGYYTCLLAHLAWKGRTIAYEADPQMHALLEQNVAINWSTPVVNTVNAAVGATAGELTLYRWVQRSGNSGIIDPDTVFPEGAGPGSVPFTVRSVPLDSLVGELPRVDVVKIDVEGAEHLVVAGMSRFVARYKPTIVLEWSPSQMVQAGSSPQELAAAIAAWNPQVSTIAPDGSLSSIGIEALADLSYQNVVIQPG